MDATVVVTISYWMTHYIAELVNLSICYVFGISVVSLYYDASLGLWSYTYQSTVCPGSSDPPEKIFCIFAPENEVYTSF